MVSCSGGTTPEGSRRKPEALLEWRVWLVARQAGKGVAALGLILLGSFLIAVGTGRVILGLVALALLLLATREFFLPVRYRISEEGAWAEGFMSSYFIPWGRVKRFFVSEEGMKLSPLRRSGRLEAFRGVYLRFADNREEVVEMVKRLAGELQ